MPHLSPEVWTIAAGVVILWFTILYVAERIEAAIRSLKADLSAIELHLRLRDAP